MFREEKINIFLMFIGMILLLIANGIVEHHPIVAIIMAFVGVLPYVKVLVSLYKGDK